MRRRRFCEDQLQLGPGPDPAREVELGFVVERRTEPLQRLLEPVVADVVEAGRGAAPANRSSARSDTTDRPSSPRPRPNATSFSTHGPRSGGFHAIGRQGSPLDHDWSEALELVRSARNHPGGLTYRTALDDISPPSTVMDLLSTSSNHEIPSHGADNGVILCPWGPSGVSGPQGGVGNMRSHRLMWWGVLGIVSSIVFAACSGAGGTRLERNAARSATTSRRSSPTPSIRRRARGTVTPSSRRPIYDTLIHLSAGGDLEPGLATSWSINGDDHHPSPAPRREVLERSALQRAGGEDRAAPRQAEHDPERPREHRFDHRRQPAHPQDQLREQHRHRIALRNNRPRGHDPGT